MLELNMPGRTAFVKSRPMPLQEKTFIPSHFFSQHYILAYSSKEINNISLRRFNLGVLKIAHLPLP